MAVSNILLYLKHSRGIAAKVTACRYFFRKLMQKFRVHHPNFGSLSYLILDDLKIHFNMNSPEIGYFKEIFIERVYERHEEIIPKPGWHVLDLGANIGLFALCNSHRVAGGKIFCFEPNPLVFPVLLKNLEANHLVNVQAFHTAIGEKSGKALLRYNPLSTGSGSIMDWRSSNNKDINLLSAKVNIETLDSFIKKQNIQYEIDLIKMDVEGAEMEAIRGGHVTLKATRRLIMEYHDQALLLQLQDQLAKFGFRPLLHLPHPDSIIYFIKN